MQEIFYENWLAIRCPSCNTCCWFYNGHSESYKDSQPAFRCWSCGNYHWLDETCEEEAKLCYGDDILIKDHAYPTISTNKLVERYGK